VEAEVASFIYDRKGPPAMTASARVLVGIAVGLLLASAAQGQHTHASGRAIAFPHVPGYLTLKCDFHTHTVFSDGSVWPDIRVQEALRDGLDAIAITDHLEYQPHQDDIPHPDRNRSHAIAVESAGMPDLIVLNGAEITRDMPPGHANAIFVQDANRLLLDDPIEVFREARRQGGFTFWNHPNWTDQRDDGVATLTEMHLRLIREGLLNGVEVVNDLTYSDEALQIALEHDLTIVGTSDIHGFIDWQYDVPQGGHRPVTLVFATERSAEGIREALEARRTAIWFNNTLIGRDEYLVPLIDASLRVTETAYHEGTSVLAVTVENTSDAAYLLRNRSPFAFHASADVVTLRPHGATRILVKTLERRASLSLDFEVLNAVTAPNLHAEITLDIPIPGGGERQD
jgi:hypothetical protein